MSTQLRQLEDILVEIREGMPVYDVFADKVGTVRYVQFANQTADEMQYVDDARLQAAPGPVRARLLRAGYIRINTGLLTRDRYATTDQVQLVSDQGVQLRASKDELLVR